MRMPLVLLVATLALAAHVSTTRATERLVPDNYATIQAALDAAVSGDTVHVRSGTYVETLSWTGKNLFVTGEDAETTVIDADSAGRALGVGPGVTLASTLRRFTVTGGFATAGAGIQIATGSGLVVRECIVVGNRALDESGQSYGGALEAGPDAEALIEDCVFQRNFAGGGFAFSTGVGGAVYAAPSAFVTVRRSRFEQNSAAGFEGGLGGAIYGAGGSVSIERCTFLRNFAGYGGAIQAYGPLRVIDCVLRDNQSTYGASAIDAVEFSTVSAARRGGGPRSADNPIGAVVLDGNVIHDNRSIASAAVLVEGPVEVLNNTIAFNRNGWPDGAGGIDADLSATIRNNIVASNEGTGVHCRFGSTFGGTSCNDVWDNQRSGSPTNYGGECPDLTGIFDNISDDPLFCAAAARDFRLRPDSPCNPIATTCGLIGALGVGCATSVEPGPVAGRVALRSPRPHPIRPGALLGFSIERSGPVRLELFDAAGRFVARLADREFDAGHHEIPWTPRHAPGVYFLSLRALGAHEVRRIVVVP